MNSFLRHLLDIMDQLGQPAQAQAGMQPGGQQQMGPPAPQPGATMQIGKAQIEQPPKEMTIPGLNLTNQGNEQRPNVQPAPMGRRGAETGDFVHPMDMQVGKPQIEPQVGIGHVTIEHPNGAKMAIPGEVFQHIMKSRKKK